MHLPLRSMRRHWHRLCRHDLAQFGNYIGIEQYLKTSPRRADDFNAVRLEIDPRQARHGESLDKAAVLAGQALKFIVGHEHMGSLPRSVMMTGPLFAAFWALLTSWFNSPLEGS